MIVAAGFVPATPLLVPDLGAGAAPELAGLRAACREVLADLAAARSERVVIIGGGHVPREHPADAAGSFAGFGVDLTVGGPGRVSLPPTLSLGAWLLDDAGWTGDRLYCEVASAEEDGTAASRRILTWPGRSALLVVADGSATRTAKAPGGFDSRSVDFDGDMARAFESGDLRLGPIDTESGASLAAQLHVGGVAAWRLTAQVLGSTGRPVTRARLLRHEAPYGVGYFAASWTWEITRAGTG
ncbi:MAG: hypothetical protein ABWZ26_03540 [Candidatus Nanopelagicales bacterium]